MRTVRLLQKYTYIPFVFSKFNKVLVVAITRSEPRSKKGKNSPTEREERKSFTGEQEFYSPPAPAADNH